MNKMIFKTCDENECLEILIKFSEIASKINIKEIQNFNFEEISDNNRSQSIFVSIPERLKYLCKSVKENQCVIDAFSIVRTLFEDIEYLIVTSYDSKFHVTLDTKRNVIKNKLEVSLNDKFKENISCDDMSIFYELLCKLNHPSIAREMLFVCSDGDYSNKSIKAALLTMVITLEYIYLTYLNSIFNKDNDELINRLVEFNYETLFGCSLATKIITNNDNLNYEMFSDFFKGRENISKLEKLVLNAIEFHNTNSTNLQKRFELNCTKIKHLMRNSKYKNYL